MPLESFLLLPEPGAREPKAPMRPFVRVAPGTMKVERVTQRRREQRMIIAGSSKNMTQARIERREAAIEGRIRRLAGDEV